MLCVKSAYSQESARHRLTPPLTPLRTKHPETQATASKQFAIDKPILQRTATRGDVCRRIVAPKGAGSSPVGHPCRRGVLDFRIMRFSQYHLEDILGSSRAASAAREYPCCMSDKQRVLRVGVLGAGP